MLSDANVVLVPLQCARTPPARQTVDRDDARPALCCVSRGRSRLLDQRQGQQQDRHCFGRTNWPPVPVRCLASMFLKSGSEVKPVPLRCWVGESKVKSRSELTSFRV